MEKSGLEIETEASAEQAQGIAARRQRDRALTMSERLDRLHELCAQLSSLRPAPRRPMD